MPSSWMVRRVALVRTDVSSIIRLTSSPILVTLMMESLNSYETSVLTRATRRNVPEDGILRVELYFHSPHTQSCRAGASASVRRR
jgi:hypothetical protein